MDSRLGVELEILSLSLRHEFEDILAKSPDFRVKDWRDSEAPALWILELQEGDAAKTFSQIREIRAATPSAEVFLTGGKVDVDTLVEAMHLEVREFFPQPIKRDQVEQALSRFKARQREKHDPKIGVRGQVFSVIGGKGGVGATTVAVNLALLLRHAGDQPSVALVDLNAEGPDVPLFLDLKPEHGLGAVANDIRRLDLTYLNSLLSSHPSGVSVLALNDVDQQSAIVAPECALEAVKLLSSVFDYIVVDGGQGLSMINRPVLEISSHVLVVSTVSAPVARKVKDILGELTLMEIPAQKVHLVMNRCSAATQPALKEIEDFLQRECVGRIPNDYDLVSRAINEGRPVVELAPRSKIVKSLSQVTQMFLPAPKPVQSKFFNILRSWKASKEK